MRPPPLDSEIRELENFFSYHRPQGDQNERYIRIRNKAKELALLILQDCPRTPDRTVAIRKIREAVMTANASIACGEPQAPEKT